MYWLLTKGLVVAAFWQISAKDVHACFKAIDFIKLSLVLQAIFLTPFLTPIGKKYKK